MNNFIDAHFDLSFKRTYKKFKAIITQNKTRLLIVLDLYYF